MANDLHARRRQRFGQQPRAPPHPALGQMNLATFEWEAHGESLAALRFLLPTKMPESRALSKPPSPFRGKPAPVSPQREKVFVARDSRLISGGGLGCNCMDSRFRGNDGGESGNDGEKAGMAVKNRRRRRDNSSFPPVLCAFALNSLCQYARRPPFLKIANHARERLFVAVSGGAAE